MLNRIMVTAAILLLAIGAFWGDALGAGYVFNPIGILLLVLAVLVWRHWGSLRAAFLSAKNESELPITRLGYTAIKGLESLRHGVQPHRSSS